MPLPAGTRLGPYEIVSPLGAGGMGEVYKARDTRLDRTVAIKVLPAEMARDPLRRERLRSEARAISGLTHPHICTLYDVGEENDIEFLVMEYLAGETLAHRLLRGALALEEVLRIGVQLADALDAAHRAGLTHRDLKPANVMLTAGGAKVLDFGLAKWGTAPDSVIEDARTATSPTVTQVRTIVGTIQYIAPEQVDGKPADARSDLFALGAIIYEMTTGRKAFEGASTTAVMAAILTSEPPLMTTVRPVTPKALDRLVRKCLAKDPVRRWQTASDLRDELVWIEEGADDQAAVASNDQGRTIVAKSSRRVVTVGSTALGVLMGVLATTLGSRLLLRQAEHVNVGVTRTIVGVTPADQLRSVPTDAQGGEGRPSRTALALSPDGRFLVFSAALAGHQHLYVRSLEQVDATPIPGTEDGMNPFFSPDGRWVGFWANGALKKTPLAGGGPPTTICETGPIFGASWASTNTIVFARESEGLLQVSADGGTARALTTLDAKRGEFSHRLPFVLPGGAAVVFTVTHNFLARWQDARLAAVSIATGERRDLGPGADARYVPTGHLIFMQAGTLVAAPFDLARLNMTAGPVSLVANVMQAGRAFSATVDTGAGQFTASASGTLAYVPGGLVPEIERTLVWVDRHGVAQPLAVPVGPYFGPMLSRDGRYIVLWTQSDDRNVWLHDVERRTLTRLTSEGSNSRGIWTPDGTRVVFGSAISGVENLFWKAADGSGVAERLTTSFKMQVPSSWSPDAKTLAFVEYADGTFDIRVMSLKGDRQPYPITQTRFNESYPEFSPDGRWIAYVSDESGRNEVYVRPFPGPGPRHQISSTGGTQPAWSHTGRELFYTDYVPFTQRVEVRVLAVPVILTPTFSAGTPLELFKGQYAGQGGTRGYDVTPDGQKFLMAQTKERPPMKVTQMILVQNWSEELKGRVPAK